MKTYTLSFARIDVIRDDIAEVFIHDGIEMDKNMVDEYHEFLLNHLRPPFSLLINKVNSYTYTFDAQIKIANIDEINAMAVIVYSEITKTTTQILKALPSNHQWHLEIFSDREQGLEWLISEQEKVSH